MSCSHRLTGQPSSEAPVRIKRNLSHLLIFVSAAMAASNAPHGSERKDKRPEIPSYAQKRVERCGNYKQYNEGGKQ